MHESEEPLGGALYGRMVAALESEKRSRVGQKALIRPLQNGPQRKNAASIGELLVAIPSHGDQPFPGKSGR
jgi:hypothetical protein